MLPEQAPTASPTQTDQEREKEEQRRVIIALLFLLLSFCCIFCSAQNALWLIDRSQINGNMLANQKADYGAAVSILLAPLNGNIITEAEHDEALLLLTQTPIAGGLGVALLPNPLPTLVPTVVAFLPTLTPTPTFTPTVSSPGPPPAPTAIAPTPQPTVIPPTVAPTQPPVTPGPVTPTSPAPTVPPTAPPTLPPTVPPTTPPTIAPTTPPAPTAPPTVPPTAPPTSPPPTATTIPTATATNPPPNTPTSTPTNTPIPVTIFFAPGFSVNENNVAGSASITVSLSGTYPQTITVNYATAAGSATAGGVDYTDVNGTLTFAPGDTSETFNVPVFDDNIANEGNETVSLTLSNPNPAAITISGTNPATLTIVDNELTPTLQFNSPTYTVAETGGLATITVTLSNPSATAVTVNYATSNNTAEAGGDYLPAAGTLNFTPLSTSQTFNVTILDDAGQEDPDEIIDLDLSNPSANASLGGSSTAILTIQDPEDTGTCNPASSTTVVEFGPPNCIFTDFDGNTLTEPMPSTITVDGNNDYDLVYYERESVIAPPSSILFDQVTIQVSADSVTWYTVFVWGDTNLDTNTNIGQAGYGGGGGEPNDTAFPMTVPPLYQSTGGGPITGVAIDIDNPNPALGLPPPNGSIIRFVRLIGGGVAEVDSIEVLP